MVSPLSSRCCERQHMRAGEIAHMNVVTHGRAVRRRIVCSKHRDIGSSSRSRIEDKRNEMGLRIVILADLSRRDRRRRR